MARYFGSNRSRHVDRKWSQKPKDPKLAATRFRVRIHNKEMERRAMLGRDGVKVIHYTTSHSDTQQQKTPSGNLFRSQLLSLLTTLFWIAFIALIVWYPFFLHDR